MKNPEQQSQRKLKADRGIHEVYMFSLIVKGIGALAETMLGTVLLFSANIVNLVLNLIENELIDDPNDFIATHFHNVLNPSPEMQVYGGLYLGSHGVVKLFLIVGLLRNKLWAYPASLAVFALFIVYQLIRYTRTHSVWLLVLTVLDIIVMWLIWHEYRQVLARSDIKRSSEQNNGQ